MRASVDSSEVPLILGIHGPPGHGKTFQLTKVLNELDAKPFVVSGAQLEDPDAAVPRNTIWQKYQSASAAMEKGVCGVAVLIINDIDTGIGAWGTLTQYTVNRQIVFGCLMDLSDDPSRAGDVRCLRVPLIVTGNDFTTLHGPLVRLGRMTLFEWQMTFDEKVAVMHHNIFPNLRPADCRYLVKSLEKAYQRACGRSAPLSLYSAVKDQVQDDCLWDAFTKGGLPEGLRSKATALARVDVRTLLEKGMELVRSQRLNSHTGTR